MTNLSNGTDSIVPVLVDGYESESEHGNIVHHILGSEEVDVVLRPASLRSGEMVLSFGLDEAASAAAENLLREASVWSLITADVDTINMSFVVKGIVRRTLDDQTRAVWLVTFGWQEVSV